jgi:hypothetical protein
VRIDACQLDKDLIWQLIAGDFWSRVDINQSENGCWLWKGCTSDTYPGYTVWRNLEVQASHMALLLAGQPKPHPMALACHTCDVKPCVRPKHLYWGTHQTNSQDAYDRGRRGVGETHPNAKLTVEKVLIIRQMLDQKVKHKVIAERMGVKPQTITSIANGSTWKSTLPKTLEMGIDTLQPDPV